MRSSVNIKRKHLGLLKTFKLVSPNPLAILIYNEKLSDSTSCPKLLPKFSNSSTSQLSFHIAIYLLQTRNSQRIY